MARVALLFVSLLLLGVELPTPAVAQSSSAALYGLVVSSFLAQKRREGCEFPVSGSWHGETAEAVARLGDRLLQRVRQAGTDRNIVFSPLSLASAFALVYFGARGQTRSELDDVFGFEGGKVPSMLGRKIVMHGEGSTTGARVANRVYLSEGASIDKCYAEAVNSESVQFLPFARDPTGSRNLINNYVGRVTNGHIQNIIPPGLITAQTDLVLANAVYFQGAWAEGFPKEMTHKKIFKSVYGDQEVDFMSFQKEKSLGYKYMEELKSEMIELPYKGGKFSMFILFPNSQDGWRDVEQKLGSIDANTLFSTPYKWSVVLQLPKWKMEMEMPGVKDHLAALGLPTLFSASADLSGITGERNKRITDVVHKAKITVNEEGTAAAAATVALSTRTVFIPEYITVNHPFLFFVVEKSDNVVYFQGTVTNLGQQR